MKITLVANTSWYLYNFRLGLIKGLMTASHEVCTLAPQDEASIKLEDCGCTFINLNINNRGLNPLADFQLRSRLIKIYKKTQPDVIIHYTIKPVIYGSMAATKQKIPFVNNITGLGTAFINNNWITWLVKQLYQSSQKKVSYIFFQNREDQNLFQNENLIPENIVQEVIPGTGINIKHFSVKPYPDSVFVKFLLIARLIWDKGVGEFVEAAKQIKSEFSEVHFQLLGFLDVKNRTAISREQVQAWKAEGVIEYLGDTEDVRPYIEKVSCIVLPSYREGLPRTLLEAAAIGRPIIATNVTGCREVVEHGVNGYLCKARDTNDLAQKMRDMINLSSYNRREMGLMGRKKMEENFDEKMVVEKIVNRIESVVNTT